MAKSVITLGQADLCSDIPPGEASTGHEWHYFRSGRPLFRHTPRRGILLPRVVLLQVRLTFDHTYLQLMNLVAMSNTNLGQVTLWSDISPSISF